MDWSWVASTQGVVGLVISITTLAGFVGVWFRKRVKAVVRDMFASSETGKASVSDRMATLEGDMRALRDDVDRTDGHVSDLSRRVGGIEGQMRDVAGDVRELRTKLDGLDEGQRSGFARVDRSLNQILGALLTRSDGG